MSSFAWLMCLAGLALLAHIVIWQTMLIRSVSRRFPKRPPLPVYPSVTVIRPVRGADVGAAENFTAALATGYPGEVETLFVFDEASDPGVPIAEAVIATHRREGRPGRAELVIAGVPPRGRTGKLHAMSVGVKRATGELIAFGDSDTRPDQDVLRVTVETLMQTPNAGSAFAPVLVREPVRAHGDALYALMQNGLYSPTASYRAGVKRELPFIMGQLMVFTREALDRIGGVESATGHLVDDMFLGEEVHAKGLKNVMGTHPLYIETDGMTIKEFIPIYSRWMMFSRNGIPLSFSWPQWMVGVEFFAATAVLIAGLATEQPLVALPSAVALVALCFLLRTVQMRYGGAPLPLRYLATPILFYALSPYVLLTSFFRHRVVWRGRVYKIDDHAGLTVTNPAMAPATPPPPQGRAI